MENELGKTKKIRRIKWHRKQEKALKYKKGEVIAMKASVGIRKKRTWKRGRITEIEGGRKYRIRIRQRKQHKEGKY